MADDFEDVSGFSLSVERERVLYEKQTECTFMWTTRDGDPVGVIELAEVVAHRVLAHDRLHARQGGIDGVAAQSTDGA